MVALLPAVLDSDHALMPYCKFLVDEDDDTDDEDESTAAFSTNFFWQLDP